MWSSLFSVIQFSALILLLYMLVVFAVALWKEDNSIVDIAYGFGFVWVTAILYSLWEATTFQQKILVVLITLWGLRLTARILFKNWRKPEDFRYQAWREAWTRHSMLYFFFRSLFQVYLLQGLVILVVLSPVLIAFSQISPGTILLVNWIGLGIWCIGFFFEAVGDWQLDRFLQNPKNQGKIMTTGLWRYTRHPNYFGEASMWWGIWLFVLGLPLASFALVSPLLITWLLLKVSGIPMLEAKFAGRSDWGEYRARTNAFFPWFPKRSTPVKTQKLV